MPKASRAPTLLSRAKDRSCRTAPSKKPGRLAAYYSKGRDAEKVEIDYIQKKQVKKTPGGKPGFVIYHTNYSLLIDPDIRNIQQVK